MADAGYVHPPGPADREDFFAAQARNRRASWWFTAWSAVAIAVMGIPLSAVVSPLLYALGAIVLDLVNFVVPTPDVFAALAETEAVSSNAPLPPETVALLVTSIVVPGSVVLLLAWLGVRRLFRRAGAGATVLALGARPPRDGDLEERQLVNVVAEMAAAAGVPPPDVMLLDSPVPNAAAVGARLDDCTVVVTTGLLTELGRAETQAVVAHLVASVGNGDLRIGATITSVFQTLGLVGSVLRAPAEGRPRTTLRRLLRYAFGRPGADDAAAVADLLAAAGTDADADYTDPDPGSLKSMLLLPFLAAGMAFSLTSMIFGFLLVNPFLRRAWRARRHLADAGAVRLTRDPDALARALATMAGHGGVVPGTEWTAHLFAIGKQDPAAGAGSDEAPMTTYQPKVADRAARLRAMGATAGELPGLRPPNETRALRIFAVATSPCWVPMLAVVLALPVVLTGVSLAIYSLFLMPAVALLHVLLRNLAG